MKKIGIISWYKKEEIDQINRVAFEYVSSIEKTWSMPFIIPCNIKNYKQYINLFDSFIFIWWDDIDPVLYNKTLNWSYNTNKNIDHFLYKFMKAVIKENKPLLWICKWMQMINIVFWWTLIQHIENADFHYQYKNQFKYTDDASISKKSFLINIFCKENIKINSVHHQGIWRLWNNLKICAKSNKDNIIEWIQHKKKPIYWVQWHPECLKNHQKIFNWFCNL